MCLKGPVTTSRNPRWLVETVGRTLLVEGMPHFENGPKSRRVPVFSANAERSLTRDSLNWADIEWMRTRWKGRLLIKGNAILEIENSQTPALVAETLTLVVP